MAGGRGISALNQAEIDKDDNHPVIFVKLEFDSVNGTQYIHNSLGPYTWGSQVWQGISDLGSIETIQEGEELSAYEMRMRLSGLGDGDYLDELINQNFYGDGVTVYQGYLDDNHDLVDDPFQLWAGDIDTLSVVIGTENEIELVAESDLVILDKANGSMYSDANLQDEFPGDLFFKFAAQMKNTQIVWGGKTVQYNGVTNPIGGFPGIGRPGSGGGGFR